MESKGFAIGSVVVLVGLVLILAVVGSLLFRGATETNPLTSLPCILANEEDCPTLDQSEQEAALLSLEDFNAKLAVSVECAYYRCVGGKDRGGNDINGCEFVESLNMGEDVCPCNTIDENQDGKVCEEESKRNFLTVETNDDISKLAYIPFKAYQEPLDRLYFDDNECGTEWGFPNVRVDERLLMNENGPKDCDGKTEYGEQNECRLRSDANIYIYYQKGDYRDSHIVSLCSIKPLFAIIPVKSAKYDEVGTESIAGWLSDSDVAITADNFIKKVGEKSVRFNSDDLTGKMIALQLSNPLPAQNRISFYTLTNSIGVNEYLFSLTDISGRQAFYKEALLLRDGWELNELDIDDFQLASGSFDWQKIIKIEIEIGGGSPSFRGLWIDGLILAHIPYEIPPKGPITLFEHQNFERSFLDIEESTPDIGTLKNDVDSIKLKNVSYGVTLYEKHNPSYSGKCRTFFQVHHPDNIKDLDSYGFGDEADSVIVWKDGFKGVILYQDDDGGPHGNSPYFPEAIENDFAKKYDLTSFENNRNCLDKDGKGSSAIRIAEKYLIAVFTEKSTQPDKVFSADVNSLRDFNLNDKVAAIKVCKQNSTDCLTKEEDSITPHVVPKSHTAGKTIQPGTTETFEVNVADNYWISRCELVVIKPDQTINTIKMELKASSESFSTPPTKFATDFKTASKSYTFNQEGKHDVSAKCMDLANNVHSTSVTVTVSS